MLKKYLYNPGDLLIEYWEVEGNKINVARYLVYDKQDIKHEYLPDVFYTCYSCYVMYTGDPYQLGDKSGLDSVGDTHEIVCWNDMEQLDYNYPTDGIEVVKSGLTWEDVD